jgi:hypothetical protein
VGIDKSQDDNFVGDQQQIASATALPPFKPGPHVELQPNALEFFAEIDKKDSSFILVKNTGSTVLFWELVEVPVKRHYAETVASGDPMKR